MIFNRGALDPQKIGYDIRGALNPEKIRYDIRGALNPGRFLALSPPSPQLSQTATITTTRDQTRNMI